MLFRIDIFDMSTGPVGVKMKTLVGGEISRWGRVVETRHTPGINVLTNGLPLICLPLTITEMVYRPESFG
jgi:hypothetical protein